MPFDRLRLALSGRWPVVALATILALLSWLDYRAWAAEHQRLYQLLDDAGVLARRPSAARELRRLLDPERAKVLAARQLLGAELDRSWQLELSAERRRQEAARGLERLRTAALLAGEAAASRPASWSARTVQGAATFLAWSRAGDRRLGAERWRWEAPLAAALRLAPSQAEPARFLAAAYLSEWSRLPPGKRRQATALLGRAFEDQTTFISLFESWLRLAPSLEAALSVVPDEPYAWQRLQQAMAARQDWERYCQMRERWQRSLLAALEGHLEIAERRRRGGDLHEARARFLLLVEQSTPSHRQAPLMERVLAGLPPGPLDPYYARRLDRWLEWSLDRCVRDHCPLSPAAIERLAQLGTPQPAPRQALAALAGGDAVAARGLERRFGGEAADWAPYWLLAARRAAAASRDSEARAALARVSPGGTLYWLTARAVALATGDAELTRLSAAELERLGRGEWPATAWQRRGDGLELELFAPVGASGLTVELDHVDSQGAALELTANGDLLGLFAVAPGDRLQVARALPAGPHRLRLVTRAGGGIHPGSVRLRPPP